MKYIIVTAFTVIFFSLYFLYNNLSFLSSVACNSGNQSATYEFLIERIYKIISHNDDDYLSYLDNQDNKSCYITWLRILSVSGANGIDTHIYSYLNEGSDNDQDYIYHYLNNVGVAGSTFSIPLLKDIINSDDSDELSKRFSAHSLYLLEGTKPSKDDDYYFIISEKQFLAHEIIKESKGRCRTFDEMVALDQLYRRTPIIVHKE